MALLVCQASMKTFYANATLSLRLLKNSTLRCANDPSLLDDVGLVVLDEGHMIGLGEREVRYEVQIQKLLKREDAEGTPNCLSFRNLTGWRQARRFCRMAVRRS